MKIVTIMNSKGGVGKTTTAHNMSYILATTYHKKVLAIDMDPSGNLTSAFGFQLEPDFDDDAEGTDTVDTNSSQGGVLATTGIAYSLPPNRRPILRTILHTSYEGVDLSAATPNLKYTAYHLKEETMAVFRLRDRLKEMPQDLYDYVIIDSKGSKDSVTDAQILASDELIFTMTPDIDALNGVTVSVENISRLSLLNPNVHIACALFTNVDPIAATRMLIRNAPEQIDIPFMNTYIRYSAEVKNARLYTQACSEYKPGCKPAKDYENFVAEYLGLPPVYPDGGFRTNL